jgi:hypothetical protein
MENKWLVEIFGLHLFQHLNSLALWSRHMTFGGKVQNAGSLTSPTEVQMECQSRSTSSKQKRSFINEGILQNVPECESSSALKQWMIDQCQNQIASSFYFYSEAEFDDFFSDRFRNRYKLVRPIPSICAARTRLPSQASSTRRMCCRRTSSNGSGRQASLPVLVCAAGFCRFSGKSSTSMNSFTDVRQAQEITFSSSRTLPGQAC